MANAALFIGWGQPARGRERQAMQLFGQAVQYYAGLQQRGEIESFEPVMLSPHGGDLHGFFLLRGEREKLGQIAASDEFQLIETRAMLCLDGVGVVHAAIGEDLQKDLARFEQSFADLT